MNFLPDDPSRFVGTSPLLLILFEDSASTEQYYQILPIPDNSYSQTQQKMISLQVN